MKIVRLGYLKHKLKLFITSFLIKLSKSSFISFDKVNESQVTFVMGMFRSGTSLTCQILMLLGLKTVSHWRLLKAKGELKDLNPDGFFEDFLFIQLPFYWCSLIDKSGDNPPTVEDIENFKLKPIRISDFITFSEFVKKEQRISFLKRHYLYLLLIVKKEKIFDFKKGQFVKSPMLTPFYVQLKEWYPNAKFIIVIRNPESTIKSSLQLSPIADLKLFNIYYKHLLNLYNTTKEKSFIFSYDNLLSSPDDSVNAICKYYDIPFQFQASSLIKRNLIRNYSRDNIKSNYYEQLYVNSINFSNNSIFNKKP